MEKKYWCISWYYLIPLVIALGALFITGAGIKRNIDIYRIKDLESLQVSDVRRGMYLEGYITDFLGAMSELPGEDRFYPLCGGDPVTMECRYIIPLDSLNQEYVVSTDKENETFITLIVKRRFQDEVNPYATNGYSARPYYITGKVVKLSGELPYEEIGSILGTNQKEEIGKQVSERYAIQLVDLKEEKKGLLKGVCLLVADALFFVTFFLPINVLSVQEKPQFPFQKKEKEELIR